MKKRNLISVLALFIVGIMLFTACNTGGSKNDPTPVPTPTPEPSPEEVPEYLGLPIVEEKLTLNFMRFKHPSNKPLNEMPMFQRLEEATNIHIEWEDVAHTAWLERLGLALASGDIPDAIFGGGVTDYDVLTNKSVFLPLGDLINQYAPNVVEMFNKRPEAKAQSTADDGLIYSLPMVYEYFYSETTPSFGINKVWLDNLGLSMPTTTEEFYNVLKAFKEGDPNGNGDTTDEIPFTFAALDNAWAGAAPFFGSFGCLPFGPPMQIINDELVYPHTMEGFKEGIKWFHQLYSEGLIDPEVFTQDATQYISNIAMDPPIAGVFGAWTFKDMANQNRRDEYVHLLPLKGPNGDQLYARNTPQNVIRHWFLVSAKTEYPDIIMRWINECYTFDMAVQMLNGSYGVTIEKNEDGSISYIDPPEGVSRDIFVWENATVSYSPTAFYEEWQDLVPPTQATLDKVELNDALMPYLPEKVYPNIFYGKDVLDELTPLQTDIDAFILEKVTNWIVNGGVEEEWDAYVQQLNQMGLQRMIEIYTDEYEKFMALQGE
jgi:putative aldouronate transport system substrate-binding protein